MANNRPALLDAFLDGYMAAPKSLPSYEVLLDLTNKLIELVDALEAHPAWQPQSRHPGLFHVYDFSNRSLYIMTELDNIREGKPVYYPTQIPPNENATSPEHAAVLSYRDVCTRIFTVDDLIQNPRTLGLLGFAQIDFGENIRQLSRVVRQAVIAARNTVPAST